MNKIFIIAFCLFYGISKATAQNDKIQDHCKQLPMKAGDVTYSTDDYGVKHSNSFIVSSTQNEVYSLTRGNVTVVIHFPDKDYQAVGVAYAGDTVIEYTMLMEVAVEKGDVINKGDIIGKATPDQKTGKNEAAIEIKLPHKGKKLTNQDVMSFIKRADN